MLFCSFVCVSVCALIREGREELQNVLTAFAVRNPAIGYVNSFSHIAVSSTAQHSAPLATLIAAHRFGVVAWAAAAGASNNSHPPLTHPLLHPLPLCQAYFLLYYKEEDAFWILCALVDIVLPPDYFTQSLLGRNYAPAMPKGIAMCILGGLLRSGGRTPDLCCCHCCFSFPSRRSRRMHADEVSGVPASSEAARSFRRTGRRRLQRRAQVAHGAHCHSSQPARATRTGARCGAGVWRCRCCGYGLIA